MGIDVSGLAARIMKDLTGYSEEMTEAVKKAVDRTAKEADGVIRSHAAFKGRGRYLKAFTISKTYEDRYARVRTWHVKSPYYRLTHLLEKGHALRGGGRARAFPHIAYGEEYVRQNLEKNIQEEMERNGH